MAASAALAASLASATSATSATGAALASLARLEPKVLVPFEQRAGRPPRRIEIERKKRLFASQDIEKLLLSTGGIDYARYGVGLDHATGGTSYLPLEIFDNVEYEIRTPQEWIALGRNEIALAKPDLLSQPEVLNSLPVSIPVKALRFEDAGAGMNGGGHFTPGLVVGYDEAEERFLVKYLDTPSIAPVLLHRIHIYFEAESPFDFVARIIFAHRTRRSLENSIRYSLYVDSMPTDEVLPLDSEQVNRILLLALNTKKLRQNALDTTSLLNEVNIDYGRTMNKIIFDVNLKDPSQSNLRQQLQLTTGAGAKDGEAADPSKAAADSIDAATALVASSNSRRSGAGGRYQYLGVVSVPPHDFPKHFSNFCFHSFCTKLEAITAMVKVNAECLRLHKLTIFNTTISKSVRLEEFEQLQNSSMMQLSGFLKDKWILALKASVKNSLRESSKGWLNLYEKNREVYALSKLAKFMKMIQFMMEDALRFLVEDSLRRYKAFLGAAAKFKVDVRETNEVSVGLLDEATIARGDKQAQDAAREAAAELARENAIYEGAEGGEAASLTSASSSGSAAAGLHAAAAAAEDPSQGLRPRDFALFTVDLILKDGVVQYTTSPAMFHSVPLALFDKALASLQDISQLEVHVMEHLFWAGNESKLVSVQREEAHVATIYQQLSLRLQMATKPMSEYLEKFSKYTEFLALNIDAYVAEFASLDNDLADIKKEISAQLAARDRIESEVPRQVWLGMLMVNTEDVRRKLGLKCTEIIQKELDYFARLTKNRCEEIQKSFQKIQAELRRSPADIQEVRKAHAHKT